MGFVLFLCNESSILTEFWKFFNSFYWFIRLRAKSPKSSSCCSTGSARCCSFNCCMSFSNGLKPALWVVASILKQLFYVTLAKKHENKCWSLPWLGSSKQIKFTDCVSTGDVFCSLGAGGGTQEFVLKSKLAIEAFWNFYLEAACSARMDLAFCAFSSLWLSRSSSGFECMREKGRHRLKYRFQLKPTG